MLWVGILLVAASGCGRSGVLEAGEGDGGEPSFPLPQGAPDGDPDPTPTPVIDAGRGLDGAVDFAADEVIDECVALDSSAASSLELESSSPLFAAGRRVLVVQMNDAIGVSGPTMPVTDFKRAGQWEIAEIASASGSTLELIAPLKNAGYTTNTSGGFRAQACLVREWTDVTIADGVSVTARPWDGNRGGVIAWQVSGTLFDDGLLSADAAGFRGGYCGSPSTIQDITSYNVPIGSGGGKGEGLDSRFFLLFGRGAVTNGGGGGNGLNAGGGGGGGAGRGGIGGGQTNATGTIIFGNDPTRGFAGGSAPTMSRLVFGGGGGAGHLNGVALSRCGGAGGGILVIQAQTLAGAGDISANGETAPAVERDGAGGGGGGGTIDLIAGDAAAFTGDIFADGGDGGDVENSSVSTYYGPGGGGGGGNVRARGVAANVCAIGGSEGVNTTNGVAWDADNGEPGITLFP